MGIKLKQECISEFIAAFVFLVFGMRGVAGLKLSGASYGQ
ncbi:hypothetical protein MEG_01243 [Bartonella tamiae Th307]|uniref:Uncharacterized protein n=1 Tax=Bartonella tamiae Th239 TaxID=1094558 RepID=J0QXI6_9HYPH|nr:hypothetical protein ME5_00639 [Bartonella tamiae Th239]EJF93412.1 hypothetical protein MEG_01243 [Bartonella tamiae Th307]